MIIRNFTKTIVTYVGGTAGDLFTYSMNGTHLCALSGLRVDNPATLKTYELKLKKGEDVNLSDELDNLNYLFVSTHLFDDFVHSNNINLLSVVVTDPDVQLKCIYRQMQLQRLRIIVNDTHEWFNIVKNHCLKGNQYDAATYWFDNAKKLWLDAMNRRINCQIKTLNFNNLFDSTFTENLSKQKWSTNLDILETNHKFWLLKNNEFNYNTTIETMANKLRTMNWHQDSGWIEYVPN